MGLRPIPQDLETIKLVGDKRFLPHPISRIETSFGPVCGVVPE